MEDGLIDRHSKPVVEGCMVFTLCQIPQQLLRSIVTHCKSEIPFNQPHREMARLVPRQMVFYLELYPCNPYLSNDDLSIELSI